MIQWLNKVMHRIKQRLIQMKTIFKDRYKRTKQTILKSCNNICKIMRIYKAKKAIVYHKIRKFLKNY
jgi:hypothetical protein